MQCAAAPPPPPRVGTDTGTGTAPALLKLEASRVDASAREALSRPPAWCADGAAGLDKLPPALRGNFRPVAGEAEVAGLRVARGALPRGLRGAFLRAGPNPRHEPRFPAEYHLFDGDGLVHWISLDGGSNTADYGRRYVRTAGLREEEDAGGALYTGMRNLMPLWDVFPGRIAAKVGRGLQPDTPWWVVQAKNPSNNAVIYHAGQLLSTWEAGSAYALAPDRSLAAKLADFGGTAGALDFWRFNFSAHPKACPTSGELYFLGYGLVGAPAVHLGVLDAQGRLARRREVPVARPAMQHDHALTDSHVVLLEQPLVFDFDKTLGGGKPFNFDAHGPVRIGLVPRALSDDEVVWVELERAFFSYHVLNAFNADDGTVVLFLFCMDETRALGMSDTVGAPAGSGQAEVGRLHRLVVDPAARRVVEGPTPWCDEVSDFPCVAPATVGQPSAFGYSVGYERSFLLVGDEGDEGEAGGSRAPPGDEEVPLFDRLIKHRLADGSSQSMDIGEGRVCGDVVFVPDSERQREEDGGWLLALAHGGEGFEGDAALLVVDAQSMRLCAEVEVPCRVPFGFHASWAPVPEW